MVVSIGAITAMAGVLLNLILGLSRVVLAMGRRRDLPRLFERVHGQHTTPVPAVLLVSTIILGLAAIGSIKAAWSFSAFTVLIYYGLTNLAALRLPRDQRLYHPLFAWCGLVGCVSLAFFVEMRYWLIGLALIAAGLAWRAAARFFRKPL
jgi:APA family basic amino acid/polyamine antiporter